VELDGEGGSLGGLLMEALEYLSRCFPEGEGSPTEYIALSGKRGLRWVLPAASGKVTGLLAAWQPYSIPARVSWGLVRLAIKGGLLSRLPGAECFDADISATDWRVFGWEERVPPAVLMYVGTAGTHRKLVVTLADPRDGTGHLVVKYPLIDTAWEKIEREYASLEEMQDEGRDIAPVPLHIDHERCFTVQTYLEGSPVGVKLTGAHYRFLAGLCQPDITTPLEEVRDQIVSRRLAIEENGGRSTEDIALLDRVLSRRVWSGNVSGVRMHGDFVPWNLKRRADNKIFAVDWEDALPVGLPFYDLYFYEMQVARLLGRNVRVDWNQYADAMSSVGHPIDGTRNAAIREAVGVLARLEQSQMAT